MTDTRRNGWSMRFSGNRQSLRRIIDVAGDILIALFGLIGLVLALRGSSWGPLWLLISLIGTAAQLAWSFRETSSGWSPLGRALVGRASSIVGTTVCVAAAGSTTGGALVATLAAAVLIGSLVLEPFVARAVRLGVPVAARLPGVPVRRSLPDLS